MSRGTMIRVVAIITAMAGMSAMGWAGEKKRSEYTAPTDEKTVLHKQETLASGDDLEANVIRFKFPPGYKGGRHYHTGDLFVYVQSGTLTVETAAGRQSFKSGELYYETPNQPMLARNLSADEDTVVIVFQVGKKGEPIMIRTD